MGEGVKRRMGERVKRRLGEWVKRRMGQNKIEVRTGNQEKQKKR